uniref:Uncharacterized protein n=1 Tax=Octopus bimaculoides TaxID=37653 RepID=A0A0L8HJA7_OCTBM
MGNNIISSVFNISVDISLATLALSNCASIVALRGPFSTYFSFSQTGARHFSTVSLLHHNSLLFSVIYFITVLTARFCSISFGGTNLLSLPVLLIKFLYLNKCSLENSISWNCLPTAAEKLFVFFLSLFPSWLT